MSTGKKDIKHTLKTDEQEQKEDQQSDTGYEADRSNDGSPTRSSKDAPVCAGCGRVFCFGGERCMKRGSGTPGFRSWEDKKKDT